MSSWIKADWPAPGGIIAGTTTREGGVSSGAYRSFNLGGHVGDDDEYVTENRRRFVTACELPHEPEWLNQVHGCDVAVAGESAPDQADAAIARSQGGVVAVLTADCLPLLLCADDGLEVGAIHGGWRGLASGVIGATLEKFDTPPARLLAWLGPAISQAAFEVGGEVRDAFVSEDPGASACFVANERGRWQADLYGIARRQLGHAGVEAVYGGEWCTYSDSGRFFSYRRDGQCGRMATFIHRQRRG
jgi:YfiH family protein